MEVSSEVQFENISKLFLLPQILRECNIPLRFDVTQKDIDTIISIKDYSFITLIQERIASIESLRFGFDCFNRERQQEYWLLTLFMHCINEQGKDTSCVPRNFRCYAKILQKMYKEGLFQLEDISILLKATLALSCVKFNLDIQRLRVIALLKYIKFSLIILEDLFGDELKEAEQEMLYDYLTFFDQTILNHDYNVYIIYSHVKLLFLGKFFAKHSTLFPMQKKLRNKLLQVITKVYMGKFDNKIMKVLLCDMQSFLINFNTKTNEELYHDCIQANAQICFIKDLIEKERIEYSKAIRQGFFFTTSGYSGMMFKSNIKMKEFTLLFSFKSLHPNIENVNQTLISFRLENFLNVLSLFIENGRLVALINKEDRKATQFQINQGESYLCMITCSKSKRSGTIALSVYCNGVLEDLKSDTKVSVKDEVNCFIGYSPEEQATYDHFDGEMGTIIFFHEKLSDKIIQFLKDLGFDYDKILYLSRYERSCLNRYEAFIPVNYNISARSFESYNQRKKEFLTQIDLVISQRSFYLSTSKANKSKVNYRHNFLDFKPKEETFSSRKVKLLAPFSNEFFFFEKKFTIVELLKLNGLQFLGLHLEYYCQLMAIIPHMNEANKMQMVSTLWSNIENIFSFINEITNDKIHLFEEGFKQFFYQLCYAISLLYKHQKLSKTILAEFFTFLNKLKTTQQELDSDKSQITFYSEIRNGCLFFLMNFEFYNPSDSNAISDVFTITDVTMKDEKSNKNLLNEDMLNQMLPFSELLENKSNKKTYKIYLILVLTFIKNITESKNSILKTFCDFLKGIATQRVRLYYFIKEIYVNAPNVFHSHRHFTHILSELLEHQLKKLNFEVNQLNCFNGNDSFSSDPKDGITPREMTKVKKLICLTVLSLLEVYDSGQFPAENESIKLHALFSDTKAGLFIFKSIIASCLSGLPNKSKYKLSLSKSIDLPTDIKWEKNSRKISYYLSLCINLFICNHIDQTEREAIILFIINCFNSLVTLILDKSYFELAETIFKGNDTLCQLFFHYCIETGFDLEKCDTFIYFTYQITNNIQNCFLFKFLLDQCHNLKAEKFVDHIFPLLLIQIYNNAFYFPNAISFGNIIQCAILIYHLVCSLRKDILIDKEFDLLKKLFEQLKKTNLLFTRIEVILENDKVVHKKLIAELMFDILIRLYTLISETNQKKLLKVFDSFFIVRDKEKEYSIPFIIDTQPTQLGVTNVLNIVKDETKQKVKDIETGFFDSYSKTESSITVFFLIKAIVYKKNLCQTEDEITDEVLNSKLVNFIKVLIDDVNSMKTSKAKKNLFKDSKENTKVMIKAKDAFEHYKNREDIEKEILQHFATNSDIDEENRYLYIKAAFKEKLSIGQLLEEAERKYQSGIANNKESKEKKGKENKLKAIKSHTSSNSLLKEENTEKEKKAVPFVDFQSVNFSGFIANTKNHYLLKIFATSYHNVFFKNDQFLQMQRSFVNHFDVSKDTKKMRFPSKFKNFSNGYYPPLFLKQDKNFFSDTYFDITHEYYKPYVEQKKIKLISFTKRKFKNEGMYKTMAAELITVEHAFFGDLHLDKQYILFESNSPSNDPRVTQTSRAMDYLFSSLKSEVFYGNKQIYIFYKDISEIMVRRFLLMHQAIEVYLKNGTSYFFNLFKQGTLNKFLKELRGKYQGTIIEDEVKEFAVRNYTKMWHNNEITSFEYLSYLNKYSTRTFRDTNQYPIFPWLMYDFKDFFNNKPKVARNLGLPITIRTEAKRQIIIEKYKENCLTNKIGYHFGCHYSTGPFIYYYLMRITPFTQLMIKLQNNELESANRMFISFDETLSILEKTDDNREIIPQFFSMIELFLNVNCIDLKKRKVKTEVVQVDNIELAVPDCLLSTYATFVLKHLTLLNSNKIKKRLPLWIDNIFGINQLTMKEDSCFIFPHYTYEKKVNLEEKLDSLKKKKKKNEPAQIIPKMLDKIQMVINFGQTPVQILKDSSMIKSENETEKAKKLSQQAFNTKFDRGIIYFDFDKASDTLYLLNSNRNVEVILLSSLKKKYDFHCKRFELNNKKRYYSNSKGKYICIAIKQFKMFILCRYLDQSIKVAEKEGIVLELLCEDFVSSLAAIDDKSFFSGLHNGKLIEWKLTKEKESIDCSQVRFIMAHDSPIYAICVNKVHNIIITSAKEPTIYIRKLFDFELLAVIVNDDYLLSVDIKVSLCNYVYILYYNNQKDLFILKGYTLNGLNFASSEEGKYNNFEFSPNGDIVIGEFNKRTLAVLSGGTLEKISEIESVKFIISKDFSWFKYIPSQNRLYLSYTNGDFFFIENALNSNKELIECKE